MSEAKIQCSGKVWNSSGFGMSLCCRNATVKWEDKWYCWQHDPLRVAKEEAKKDVKVQAEVRALEEKWKRERETKRRMNALKVATQEELLDLAEEQVRIIKSLKKELVLHTGALMADGSRIATS